MEARHPSLHCWPARSIASRTYYARSCVCRREDTVAGPCPVVLDISTTSGYGRIITVKQHLLALTSEHADLRRVAQILAWLEDLSLQDMMRASPGQIADSLDEFGTTAGYTRQEAIQHLLASIHPSELSSHDPDANTWYVT